MTDEFHLIERDENGHPQVRYALHPSEVSIIRNPDGSIHGYIWEPAGPVPSPIRTDPPRLAEAEYEDLKQRWLAAQREQPPAWRYPAPDYMHFEQRGPRRRWWRRRT